MKRSLRLLLVSLFSLNFGLYAGASSVVSSASSLESASALSSSLSEIYRQYQSTRSISDEPRLLRAAERVHGKAFATRLRSVIKNNPGLYVAARRQALAS
ncbi:MAG: hypothetical protein EOP09_17310, partial [Proteobacteria bacterium]